MRLSAEASGSEKSGDSVEISEQKCWLGSYFVCVCLLEDFPRVSFHAVGPLLKAAIEK